MRSYLFRLKASAEGIGIAPAEALALVILLSGAASLTAVVWWSNRPAPTRPDAPVIAASDDVAVSAASDTLSSAIVSQAPVSQAPVSHAPVSSDTVVVHVSGAVAAPGLVTITTPSRVADAIQAAGGVTQDAATDALNLARPVVDGEQIIVPVIGQPPSAGSVPPAAGVVGTGLISLNTATSEQLQELPGVGPATAEKILAHREAIGGFVDAAQLLEITGIGPKRFAELQELVSL